MTIKNLAAVVLGNVSLRFIPVSFNQAISATSPAFTAFLALVMQGKRESAATYAALLPIVGGIMVASRFEPSFNVFGFGACLSAAALRALKTVIGVRTHSLPRVFCQGSNSVHFATVHF